MNNAHANHEEQHLPPPSPPTEPPHTQEAHTADVDYDQQQQQPNQHVPLSSSPHHQPRQQPQQLVKTTAKHRLVDYFVVLGADENSSTPLQPLKKHGRSDSQTIFPICDLCILSAATTKDPGKDIPSNYTRIKSFQGIDANLNAGFMRKPVYLAETRVPVMMPDENTPPLHTATTKPNPKKEEQQQQQGDINKHKRLTPQDNDHADDHQQMQHQRHPQHPSDADKEDAAAAGETDDAQELQHQSPPQSPRQPSSPVAHVTSSTGVRVLAPITDIVVIHADKKDGQEQVPLGYEVLQGIIKWGSRIVQIAVKRDGDPRAAAIIDVKVMSSKKGDVCPPDYIQVRKSISAGGTISAKYICFKRAPGQTVDARAYEPVVVDRYPREDYEDYPLGTDGVSMLCFPRGMVLQRELQLPRFLTFVLTSEVGEEVYGAALMFYELMDTTTFAAIAEGHEADRQADEEGASLTAASQAREESAGNGRRRKTCAKQRNVVTTKWCPKVLCVLSHWAFYEGFKTFLNQLYRIAVSRMPLPIERYIGNFMRDVPVPMPGLQTVKYSIGHAQVNFSRPAPMGFPMTDFSLCPLFQCLSIRNAISLVEYCLAEAKVLLYSNSYEALTPVAEAVRSLLWPLRWQNVFIPILPSGLSYILRAPVPFLVGVHRSLLDEIHVSDDVLLVDLDRNILRKPVVDKSKHGKGGGAQQVAIFPPEVRGLLVKELSECVDLYREHDTSVEDASLYQAPLDVNAESEVDENDIRVAFVRVMVCFLGSHRAFVRCAGGVRGCGGVDPASPDPLPAVTSFLVDKAGVDAEAAAQSAIPGVDVCAFSSFRAAVDAVAEMDEDIAFECGGLTHTSGSSANNNASSRNAPFSSPLYEDFAAVFDSTRYVEHFPPTAGYFVRQLVNTQMFADFIMSAHCTGGIGIGGVHANEKKSHRFQEILFFDWCTSLSRRDLGVPRQMLKRPGKYNKRNSIFGISQKGRLVTESIEAIYEMRPQILPPTVLCRYLGDVFEAPLPDDSGLPTAAGKGFAYDNFPKLKESLFSTVSQPAALTSADRAAVGTCGGSNRSLQNNASESHVILRGESQMSAAAWKGEQLLATVPGADMSAKQRKIERVMNIAVNSVKADVHTFQSYLQEKKASLRNELKLARSQAATVYEVWFQLYADYASWKFYVYMFDLQERKTRKRDNGASVVVPMMNVVVNDADGLVAACKFAALLPTLVELSGMMSRGRVLPTPAVMQSMCILCARLGLLKFVHVLYSVFSHLVPHPSDDFFLALSCASRPLCGGAMKIITDVGISKKVRMGVDIGAVGPPGGVDTSGGSAVLTATVSTPNVRRRGNGRRLSRGSVTSFGDDRMAIATGGRGSASKRPATPNRRHSMPRRNSVPTVMSSDRATKDGTPHVEFLLPSVNSSLAERWRAPEKVVLEACCQHCAYPLTGEDVIASWLLPKQGCPCPCCGAVVPVRLHVFLNVRDGSNRLSDVTFEGASVDSSLIVCDERGLEFTVPLLKPSSLAAKIDSLRARVGLLGADSALASPIGSPVSTKRDASAALTSLRDDVDELSAFTGSGAHASTGKKKKRKDGRPKPPPPPTPPPPNAVRRARQNHARSVSAQASVFANVKCDVKDASPVLKGRGRTNGVNSTLMASSDGKHRDGASRHICARPSDTCALGSLIHTVRNEPSILWSMFWWWASRGKKEGDSELSQSIPGKSELGDSNGRELPLAFLFGDDSDQNDSSPPPCYQLECNAFAVWCMRRCEEGKKNGPDSVTKKEKSASPSVIVALCECLGSIAESVASSAIILAEPVRLVLKARAALAAELLDSDCDSHSELVKFFERPVIQVLGSLRNEASLQGCYFSSFSSRKLRNACNEALHDVKESVTKKRTALESLRGKNEAVERVGLGKAKTSAGGDDDKDALSDRVLYAAVGNGNDGMDGDGGTSEVVVEGGKGAKLPLSRSGTGTKFDQLKAELEESIFLLDAIRTYDELPSEEHMALCDAVLEVFSFAAPPSVETNVSDLEVSRSSRRGNDQASKRSVSGNWSSPSLRERYASHSRRATGVSVSGTRSGSPPHGPLSSHVAVSRIPEAAVVDATHNGAAVSRHDDFSFGLEPPSLQQILDGNAGKGKIMQSLFSPEEFRSFLNDPPASARVPDASGTSFQALRAYYRFWIAVRGFRAMCGDMEPAHRLVAACALQAQHLSPGGSRQGHAAVPASPPADDDPAAKVHAIVSGSTSLADLAEFEGTVLDEVNEEIARARAISTYALTEDVFDGCAHIAFNHLQQHAYPAFMRVQAVKARKILMT